ncbi:guanine deaminase [Pararhodobacter zhoushanensis]|uniref:Guanine deaminase n=1 Tax=Pararhodobacter zhoushanensis TaxID=2479545 RepID=A0ABT3GXC0_9RHOB|nr:guanine deaminase [Pararhodobacter zhoushanensis]MCW1932172.1 guanine deaminase [Pararhodobacter zhoushanensis]
MTERVLRGRVLTFRRRPEGVGDHSAYEWYEDGAVHIRDGLIVATGDFAVVAPAGVPVTDHRPHLITAGFIDAHLHFPQGQIVASWGAQLLDWLNTYTFPAETRFADPAHANRMAGLFYDLLLRNGTTTASAFCSVHPASVVAYFGEAEKRGMRMLGGKVLMDRNAPEALQDTPQTGYDDSKALIARWHGKGRALYAISPRFAITSTPAQMEAAQALIAEHPECHVQTHLSENRDEIAFACSLYPQADGYLDIYARYGMLGPKALLGHAIHLSDRERDVIAETGSHAVHCPTSNLFLGSGLFDEAALAAKGATSGIATDIGAGMSWSMLRTGGAAYAIAQLQGRSLDPLSGFWWITRGNADVLGLTDRIGTLEAGTEADLVVLDSRATPEQALRMEAAQDLKDELFSLLILGDDRSVVETYVAGTPSRPR